ERLQQQARDLGRFQPRLDLDIEGKLYCGRPSPGIFLRSFPLHSPRYARKTIAESCSSWVALATAIITHSGS
ncbi:MAG TPA: hypothetical protein VNY82_08070, partial [Steroidobacteraceae bacterium]|nr:hypothetical protein [Steroidobacteraceae bacterium]